MEIIEVSLHCHRRIDYYVCPTQYALLTGDLEGLQVLIQFGYIVKEHKMAIYNSNILLSDIPRFDFKCYGSITRYISFTTHSSSPSYTFNRLANFYEFRYEILRRSIVHEVIVFILRYTVTLSHKQKSNMEKGFRLIWRSRSTPYVRIQEVFHVLKEDWINFDCPQKCWKKLRKACNKYSLLFKDLSIGALTPRSLMHLSRCAVREALMKSSWCFGIAKLKIPSNLKDYLLLEY